MKMIYFIFFIILILIINIMLNLNYFGKYEDYSKLEGIWLKEKDTIKVEHIPISGGDSKIKIFHLFYEQIDEYRINGNKLYDKNNKEVGSIGDNKLIIDGKIYTR